MHACPLVLGSVLVAICVVAVLLTVILSGLFVFGKRLGKTFESAKGMLPATGARKISNCTQQIHPPLANKVFALAILDIAEWLHGASAKGGSPKGGFGQQTFLQTPKLPFLGAASVANMPGGTQYILVVFRGTLTKDELFNNDFGEQYIKRIAPYSVRILMDSGFPMPFPPQITLEGDTNVDKTTPAVNMAFYYTYMGVVRDAVNHYLHQAFAHYGKLPIIFGGHSLGAGLACLGAALALKDFPGSDISIITCATPKPGNAAFRDVLSQLKCVCYANEADIIPWSPYGVTPNFARHDASAFEYVTPPSACLFSYPGLDLLGSHSIAAYRAGIQLLG